MFWNLDNSTKATIMIIGYDKLFSCIRTTNLFSCFSESIFCDTKWNISISILNKNENLYICSKWNERVTYLYIIYVHLTFSFALKFEVILMYTPFSVWKEKGNWKLK